MRIGAHVSSAGDFATTVDYAVSVGCECIQVFAKSPRQWAARPLDPAVAAAFDTARRSAGLHPLFTHTAYLINLGSADDVIWARSVDALADELTRAHMLGADGVVTHIGTAAPGLDRPWERIAAAISRARTLAASDGGAARLLLENTAGAGTTYGSTFRDIGRVIDACGLDADLLGLCMDTCHAHAFGYDLADAVGWECLIDEIDACCGLERLALIHANDCAFPRGSRRDRHAWIGDGAIGMDGFAAMVCESRLRDIAVVTEMPGQPPAKDAINIDRLISLRASCEPSQDHA